MNEKQYEEVVKALADFVVRVANGKATSETEVAILPEVVNALSGFRLI